MRTITTLLLLGCFCVFSSAQAPSDTTALVAEIEKDWNTVKPTRLKELTVACERVIPALETSPNTAGLLLNCGIINKRARNTDVAIDLLKRSATAAKAAGNAGAERAANVWLGDTLADNRRLAEAIAAYEAALELANKSGNNQLIANDLSKVGPLHYLSGDVEKAVDYLARAAVLQGQRGDHEDAADTLHDLGFMLLELNRLDDALKIFTAGVTAAKTVSSRHRVVSLLRQVGDTQLRLGNFAQAVVAFREAKFWLGVDPEPSRAAVITADLAKASQLSGEYSEAMKLAAEAVELARKSGNRRTQTVAHLAEAKIYLAMGDTRQALPSYLLAYTLATATGDFVSVLEAFDVMAHFYATHDEKAKVEELCRELIETVTSHENLRVMFETRVLRKVAAAYKLIGKPDVQLSHLNRSLQLAQERSLRSDEIQSRIEIASELVFTDKRPLAIEHLEKAIELLKHIGSSGQRAMANQRLGAALMLEGKAMDRARSALIEAVFLDASAEDRRSEAESLVYLMYLESRAGNPRLATFYGKLFASRLQHLRRSGRALPVETQKALMAQAQPGYRFLIDLLIDAGRLDEAVQFSNLLKDQEFYEGNDSSLRRWEIPLTAREEKLTKQYDAVSRPPTLAPGMSASDMAISSSIRPVKKRTAAEYHDLFRQIGNEFGTTPGPSDKAPQILEVRHRMTRLATVSKESGHDVVAVYTLVGDKTLRHLLIKAGGVESVSQPIKGDEINAKAKQFWALLQNDSYDPRPLGKELYDVVFKPIESKLPANTKTILWSLDGNLRYIPVAALHDGTQYLVERYSNVTFTRADFDAMTAPTRKDWTVSAFGTSKAHTVSLFNDTVGFAPLPGVLQELDEIFGPGERKVVGGDVIIDEKFDRVALRARTKRPLIHIASHFHFRPGDDGRSFLLLGDGSPLTLLDMKATKDLFSGVELLTLSACNTAAQQPDTNGREVDAFFELAQRLGARSVLATLWPVADASTPWLMREFYDGKINRSQNKADALRMAQLALLKGKTEIRPAADKPAGRNSIEVDEGAVEVTRSGKLVISKKNAVPFPKSGEQPYAHPFYWSPFILVGNWN
jgi:CHAT domain-containing protein/tetratricopeptide (TPR) repeat protein